jgi:hypothetical protein
MSYYSKEIIFEWYIAGHASIATANFEPSAIQSAWLHG